MADMYVYMHDAFSSLANCVRSGLKSRQLLLYDSVLMTDIYTAFSGPEQSGSCLDSESRPYRIGQNATCIQDTFAAQPAAESCAA